MPAPLRPSPIDELLRARLRLKSGASRRIRALRILLTTLDAAIRVTTGQPFFAIKETEQLLRDFEGRTGRALLHRLLDRNGGTTITPHGLDHVPESGPVVLAATHPLGTFDFIAHAAALLPRRPDLKVVANREAARFLGSDMIIPVDIDRSDKVGSTRATIRQMQDQLTSGGALFVFGSGRVAHMHKTRLVEPPWRSGASRVSALCDAPLVPASCDMRNTKHYYVTRRLAQTLCCGSDYFGREIASLRYTSELLAKLGGKYDVVYGMAQPPGETPARLQKLAESLIPGLYIE